MATTHLQNGYDVIVPQLLARDTFVLELETVARQTHSRFVEVALLAGRDDTIRAFEARSASPENQQSARSRYSTLTSLDARAALDPRR